MSTLKLFAFVVFSFFSSTLFFKSTSFAQGLPFGALSGGVMPLTFQIDSFGPSLKTERSDESVTQFRGEAFIPIAQSDVDAYAVQIRGTRLTLDRDRATSAPGNGLIPQDLGSIAVGPFMRHKLESGDILTGEFQLGRSGIELGSPSTATTVTANLFWARKKDITEGQWIYLLSYSNSRSTLNNVPIPGFAYVKSFMNESAQGMWAAGVPFFFGMARAMPWSFTGLITPFTAFVEAGYSIMGPFAVFTHFGWHPQGFKVNGGPSERILYEEFRTQLGIRGPLAKWATASLGVAYSDGRRVMWGDGLTKPTNYESRLDDELNVFFNVSGRF